MCRTFATDRLLRLQDVFAGPPAEARSSQLRSIINHQTMTDPDRETCETIDMEVCPCMMNIH